MKDAKSKIIVCKGFYKRFIGFMFKRKINCILCFPKCNSIHTFFMLSRIDVVMTDKDNKILYIFNNVKPFRMIFPKRNVYYTYELPVGFHSYVIGDIFNQ